MCRQDHRLSDCSAIHYFPDCPLERHISGPDGFSQEYALLFGNPYDFFGFFRVCHECLFAQYGLSVTIARPSRVYGPTMLAEDNKAIAQFIHNVVQGEDIVLKSHGKQRYSYTYMLDVATAFLAVLLCGKDGEAYNVADEHSVVTLGGLAEAMARENGCQVVYDLSADTGAAGYSNLLNGVMDAEKLRALGWQAMVPLEEGVKKTIGILKASQ